MTTDDRGLTAQSTCAALTIQQASTLMTIPVSTHQTWSVDARTLVLDDQRTRQPPAGKARRTRSEGDHPLPAVPGTDAIVTRTKFRPVDLPCMRMTFAPPWGRVGG